MNILDVAQNSIRAGASKIDISISADTKENLLSLMIRDNGCGMNETEIRYASDPFYTTHRTKKTGMGLSLLKMASEQAGGDFYIESNLHIGTTVHASFILNHINLMPVGDIGGTISALIQAAPEIDYIFCYARDTDSFKFDTKQARQILKDIPLNHSAAAVFLREYITEHTAAIDILKK